MHVIIIFLKWNIYWLFCSLCFLHDVRHLPFQGNQMNSIELSHQCILHERALCLPQIQSHPSLSLFLSIDLIKIFLLCFFFCINVHCVHTIKSLIKSHHTSAHQNTQTHLNIHSRVTIQIINAMKMGHFVKISQQHWNHTLYNNQLSCLIFFIIWTPSTPINNIASS